MLDELYVVAWVFLFFSFFFPSSSFSCYVTRLRLLDSMIPPTSSHRTTYARYRIRTAKKGIHTRVSCRVWTGLVRKGSLRFAWYLFSIFLTRSLLAAGVSTRFISFRSWVFVRLLSYVCDEFSHLHSWLVQQSERRLVSSSLTCFPISIFAILLAYVDVHGRWVLVSRMFALPRLAARLLLCGFEGFDYFLLSRLERCTKDVL